MTNVVNLPGGTNVTDGQSGIDRFDHVGAPLLRDALRYWLNLCKDETPPAKTDFDPIEIPRTLEHAWLCYREPENGNFIYRLAGEQIQPAFKGRITGKYLHELTEGKALKRVAGYFNRTLDQPCITHVIGRVYSEIDKPAQGERLMLPLMEDGEARYIFGVTLHSWSTELSSTEPVRTQTLTHTPLGDSRVTRVIRWIK